MTTQPEDLRSERATSTDGGGASPPDVAAPTSRRRRAAAPAESGASGAPAAALPTADAADPSSPASRSASAAGAVADSGGWRAATDRECVHGGGGGGSGTRCPGRPGRCCSRAWRSRRPCCPAAPVVQGLVCGISAAIGYGVGVVAAWVWRAFADRDERPARPIAWRIFAVVARRRAGRRVRAGPALAVRDPRPHGGGGRQPGRPAAGAGAGRGRVRRPGRARPRPARGLPLAGPAARPLDRAARGPRRRLGHRRRPSPSRWSAASCWTGWCPPPTRRSRSATGSRPRARSSRPSPPGPAAPGRWSPGTPWAARAASSPGWGRPRRTSPAFTGGPALAPIRAYAGLESADVDRGPGEPGGRRPGTRRRLRPQVPRRRHDHRQRLGRPGGDGHGRVHDRRRLRDRRDPVLVPAVLDLLPGRPEARPGGRPRAVRRRLQQVVGAAAGQPAPVAGLRREPRLVRRRDGVQRRAGPAQPHVRRGLRRPAELQHALPRVHRRPRPGQPEVAPIYRDGRTVRFDDHPGPPIAAGVRRRGTGRGCSTCSTRRTRSSGGPRGCC